MPPRKRAPEYPGRHRVENASEGARNPMPTPLTHNPDDPHEKRGDVKANKRRGPKHYAAEPKRARVAKTAKPTSSAPSSGPPTAPISPVSGPRARPAARRAEGRAERIGEEARYLAQQQAIRATTAKPSITGRALAGGATGAAVGTSVAGPVGTAVGGGVGAVVGGVSGASAKKAYKAATRPYPGARRAVVAEFAICAVIVALSPMTDKGAEKPGQWMRRMTAVMGLFFILGLVSTAGRWGARAAAGFGGLVTLALVISERNLFNVMAAAFSTKADRGAESFGSTVGDAIQEGAEAIDDGRSSFGAAPPGGG